MKLSLDTASSLLDEGKMLVDEVASVPPGSLYKFELHLNLKINMVNCPYTSDNLLNVTCPDLTYICWIIF